MDDNSKLKNTKAKEKRLSNTQTENLPKKSVKAQDLPKNELSQLMAPQTFDVNSSVKKIFNEANKIVKIGMEKEFALQEKNNTLQNSNETIDNLRKNILHLQMEYEKLDQSYQREISSRSEIVKRMDATRDIVESMVQYSNTLVSSIKLIEDDKCKIAEYYELIYQSQKEIEVKHTEATKLTQEIDNSIKSKIENLKNSYEKVFFQNSETISQLNRNLSYAADKLKITGDENEKLHKKIKEFQETASELEASLQGQQNLNIINQEVISKLKFSVKKLKNQRFRYQKLLRNKKKKIQNLINIRRKDVEKLEGLLEKSKSANEELESNNHAWESKFEKQLQEEELQNQNWEARVTKLTDKIKLLEIKCKEWKTENENLNQKVLEFTKSEEEKQKQIEGLQNDLSKMLSSKINLQEDLKKLNDETARKENEMEAKMAELGFKLNSEAEVYQNEVGRYQDLVKNLERQLLDSEKELSLEKNQKEIILSDYDSKLENLKIANEKINNLEKLLEDKDVHIKEIESQQTTLTLDGKKAVEKLNKDIQAQTVKIKGLSTDLENLENNCSAVKKELQESKNKILDFEVKLNEEKLLNEELKGNKSELEKNAAVLKKQIECEKYLVQELQEKYRKADRELTELRKTVEENASLKSTVVDLKNILKATEARVEAYKVVVKKLETEKAEVKYNQVEETSKPKLELSRQEEATKRTAESSKLQIGTSQGNVEQTNKKKLELVNTKMREKTPRKEESYKADTKENVSQGSDTEKWRPCTPVQDPKKFLTTPRKFFTSTPQSGFRDLTPFKKKRDPYEFDSDCSVEGFDPEQVLKVFNRQKKETNKKSKINK